MFLKDKGVGVNFSPSFSQTLNLLYQKLKVILVENIFGFSRVNPPFNQSNDEICISHS